MWNSWRNGGIIYIFSGGHPKGSNPDSKYCADGCSPALFILLQSFARHGLECSKFETLKISSALKESLENLPVRPSSNLQRLILRTLRVVRNGNVEFQLTFPLLTHISISPLFITQRDCLRLIRCFEMLEFGSFALQQDQQFAVEASFDTRPGRGRRVVGFPCQAAAFSPRVGPLPLYKSSRIQSTIPT
jgi:hypothetical protein